ncbi:RICIN domain-containing protein [Streptomyces sp. MMS24-I31]|uniref:RICIN domain-containing protein n=1 Tax=Streptomyces sp. MMS24-I31 TaxID=3351563 RepID=UPI003896C6CB
MEGAEPADPVPGAAHTDITSRTALAQKGLFNAYLREHATRASTRECRHLAASLGDIARGDLSLYSEDLHLHVLGCDGCRAAQADLGVIDFRQPGALASPLYWPFPSPLFSSFRTGTDDTAGLLPLAAGTGGTVISPTGPHPAHARRYVLPKASLRAGAITALTAVAVVVVGAGLASREGGGTAQSRATPAATAQNSTTDATLTSGAFATSTPTGTPSASAKDRTATTTPPPAVPKQTATAAAAAPRPKPAGFQLVNLRSGLCVGIEDSSRRNDALLQLQDCTTTPYQRWERVAEGDGTYLMRNRGSGKCLDGTFRRGNVVRVVQWDCFYSAGDDQDVQLWSFRPAGSPSSYRLLYMPTAGGRYYDPHLLGPEEGSDRNPPDPGTYLAHLTDYYDSDSFVFTMTTGT